MTRHYVKFVASMNRMKLLQPFRRIGGKSRYEGILTSRVQTDGSFGPKGARAAAIISGYRNIFSYVKPIYAEDSMEAEWASVSLGIQLALENNEHWIELENDNLGVMNALALGSKLKKDYARYYKHEISKLAAETMWTGVRWIPRELNHADDLFR
jgi:hypothetical protein